MINSLLGQKDKIEVINKLQSEEGGIGLLQRMLQGINIDIFLLREQNFAMMLGKELSSLPK